MNCINPQDLYRAACFDDIRSFHSISHLFSSIPEMSQSHSNSLSRRKSTYFPFDYRLSFPRRINWIWINKQRRLRTETEYRLVELFSFSSFDRVSTTSKFETWQSLVWATDRKIRTNDWLNECKSATSTKFRSWLFIFYRIPFNAEEILTECVDCQVYL